MYDVDIEIITRAINELKPGSTCTILGNDYSNIIWLDDKVDPPSVDEIEKKIQEILKLNTAKGIDDEAYSRIIKLYPIKDQLDFLSNYLNILNDKIDGTITPDQVKNLEDIQTKINNIGVIKNVAIELQKTLPDDYKDDKYWPNI